MPDDWSHIEAEAAVADYFDMLDRWLRDEPVNKAEHNRRLQTHLMNRSRGSIEWKHQNISAVLIELGYPYLAGYKPRFNYQELLRAIVIQRLSGASDLQQAASDAVNKAVITNPVVADILSIVVPPPVRQDQPTTLKDRPRDMGKAARCNFLEIEAKNASLGAAGEQFVLQFEHERLWRAGKRALADRIEHVAKSQGDHVGYDILSFEENGRERLIEVNTTRFGSLTPFFASRNEVTVSEAHDNEYQLYRLFNFTDQPKLFVLAGALGQTCFLEPSIFSCQNRNFVPLMHFVTSGISI